MDSNYDLTTQDGFKKAEDFFAKNGWLISPLAWIIYRIAKSNPTVEEQAKAATSIIGAGKKNGVKEVSITLDSRAGTKLGANVEGVPISVNNRSNNTMTITATY
jgi:hypothetical protein